MAENEVLLDVGQVAAMLKISTATVRRWVVFVPLTSMGQKPPAAQSKTE